MQVGTYHERRAFRRCHSDYLESSLELGSGDFKRGCIVVSYRCNETTKLCRRVIEKRDEL